MRQFFGHLHPLLVHLPIGLIIVLAVLEWLARYRRFRNANASARFVLALAVPLAVFTAVCGWLLSLDGSYGARLLQWHKWTGIGTAAACLLVGLLYWLDLKRPYRFCLGTTIVVLTVSSHFGGSLTHGSDYLVRYAPRPIRALFGDVQLKRVKNIPEMNVFADILQPMFKEDCVSCHGPEKSEAQLRLDSLAGLLKGGKSGPALVAGKSGESTMMRRLRLPPNHKEHMPPEGKPQPNADQIALVEWWVNGVAPADKTIAALKPPPRIQRALVALYGDKANVEKAVAPKPLNQIEPLQARLADELNIPITLLSPNEPWLLCNASVAGTNFGDAELSKLAPLSNNIRWLDLAGTKVSDAGLAQVAAMPNLVRLHLERTAITDAGLARMSHLPQLEYLNLYGTQITETGLVQLQSMPKLKQLYLWQTRVTPAAAKAFAESLADEDQEQRWQHEIEQLKAKIKSERVLVDIGTEVSAPIATNAAINSQCPVSGKPVNLTKTATYKNKLVAFCCDDCKAKFEKDPEPLLAKLRLASAAEAKAEKK